MSARSVLSALDPEKYDITQIGITKDGVWLTGENILETLSNGQMDDENLNRVVIIPDQFHNRVWEIQNKEFHLESGAAGRMWMWFSPFCTAHLAKMAPCKGCSNWLIWLMWARV